MCGLAQDGKTNFRLFICLCVPYFFGYNLSVLFRRRQRVVKQDYEYLTIRMGFHLEEESNSYLSSKSYLNEWVFSGN